jgi:hypothetical protein
LSSLRPKVGLTVAVRTTLVTDSPRVIPTGMLVDLARIVKRCTSCQFFTVRPSTRTIRSPSRMPRRSSAEPGSTYPITGGLTGTGSPTAQITVAIARAKSRFITGPASATQIRDQGEAGAIARSAVPSMASEVSIWGSFTKPPAGIHRRAHSTPWRSLHPRIFGPKPMEKPSTTMRRRRAIQKWPYSCTKTEAPKKSSTASTT